jgi:hypothetical protein
VPPLTAAWAENLSRQPTLRSFLFFSFETLPRGAAPWAASSTPVDWCHRQVGATSSALPSPLARLPPITARRAPLSRVIFQLWIGMNCNKQRWISARDATASVQLPTRFRFLEHISHLSPYLPSTSSPRRHRRSPGRFFHGLAGITGAITDQGTVVRSKVDIGDKPHLRPRHATKQLHHRAGTPREPYSSSDSVDTGRASSSWVLQAIAVVTRLVQGASTGEILPYRLISTCARCSTDRIKDCCANSALRAPRRWRRRVLLPLVCSTWGR